MKKAFTLVEVNLAIMVMAVGVLGIISLYAFGFREERQSREDVASAAYADAVMGPLVTALTATNVKWSVFRRIPDSPGDQGWATTCRTVPPARLCPTRKVSRSRLIRAPSRRSTSGAAFRPACR
jgi:Tfp pilus assembly protein PilV